MNRFKIIFETVSIITVFGISMFIIESLYPLGGLAEKYLGIFGILVGKLVSVITSIGIIAWICKLCSKLIKLN